MRFSAVAVAVFFLQAAPASLEQIQAWYEAGQHQHVVDQGEQPAAPKAQYIVASNQLPPPEGAV